MKGLAMVCRDGVRLTSVCVVVLSTQILTITSANVVIAGDYWQSNGRFEWTSTICSKPYATGLRLLSKAYTLEDAVKYADQFKADSNGYLQCLKREMDIDKKTLSRHLNDIINKETVDQQSQLDMYLYDIESQIKKK